MTWRAMSAGAYRSLENKTEPSPSETSNAPEREGPAADITLDASQVGAGHCITRTSGSECEGCRSRIPVHYEQTVMMGSMTWRIPVHCEQTVGPYRWRIPVHYEQTVRMCLMTWRSAVWTSSLSDPEARPTRQTEAHVTRRHWALHNRDVTLHVSQGGTGEEG
jgi:hypothetical protein